MSLESVPQAVGSASLGPLALSTIPSHHSKAGGTQGRPEILLSPCCPPPPFFTLPLTHGGGAGSLSLGSMSLAQHPVDAAVLTNRKIIKERSMNEKLLYDMPSKCLLRSSKGVGSRQENQRRWGRVVNSPRNLWGLHCIFSVTLVMGNRTRSRPTGTLREWLSHSKGSVHLVGGGLCPVILSHRFVSAFPVWSLPGQTVSRDGD